MKGLEIGKILVQNSKDMKQVMNILVIWPNGLYLKKKRLKRKKTIDKNLQEQTNKEKEHWEKVLLRIIAIKFYNEKI